MLNRVNNIQPTLINIICYYKCLPKDANTRMHQAQYYVSYPLQAYIIVVLIY